MCMIVIARTYKVVGPQPVARAFPPHAQELCGRDAPCDGLQLLKTRHVRCQTFRWVWKQALGLCATLLFIRGSRMGKDRQCKTANPRL